MLMTNLCYNGQLTYPIPYRGVDKLLVLRSDLYRCSFGLQQRGPIEQEEPVGVLLVRTAPLAEGCTPETEQGWDCIELAGAVCVQPYRVLWLITLTWMQGYGNTACGVQDECYKTLPLALKRFESLATLPTRRTRVGSTWCAASCMSPVRVAKQLFERELLNESRWDGCNDTE